MGNQKAKAEKLKPKIGQIAMLAMAVGIIMGPWMPQMPFWFSLSGPSIALVFLVLIVLAIPIIFTYAELTAMLPFADGQYNFAGNALGYTPAWITGWLLILHYLIPTAFMGPATARMVQALFIVPEMSNFSIGLGGIGFIFIFAILNTLSISASARVQFIMVLIMVIVGIATALWFFGSGHWTPANITPFFTTGASGFTVAIGIMMVMVVGFDCIPQLSEEANYPRKNTLWIMVAAVIISECLFALICFANAGMKPTSWIVEQMVVSPEIARRMAGNVPAAIMNIAGLAATLTCLNGFMVAASRVVFAMGRARVLPPIFAKTNKYDVPHVAIWFIFVVCSLVVFIGGEGWLETLFVAASFATGIVYTLTCISAVVLRKKHPDWHRPVKTPGGIPMAVLATLIGIGIIISVAFGMPERSWIIFVVWIVIGLIVFSWMTNLRKKDEDYGVIWMTPEDIET